MKQVEWNEVIVQEFTRLAMLNELEEGIMRTRCQGYTITQLSEKFNISTRTVDRIVQKLKIKYDNVQPLSDKLPPRIVNSKTEQYLDNN